MSKAQPTAALAMFLVCLAVEGAASAPLCRPVISAKAARSAEVLNQQRRWAAVFAVDASRCATISGTFDVDFLREKESGPDLEFTQRFIWASGRTEIAMDLWWDEWIRDHRVGAITACPCRD